MDEQNPEPLAAWQYGCMTLLVIAAVLFVAFTLGLLTDTPPNFVQP